MNKKYFSEGGGEMNDKTNKFKGNINMQGRLGNMKSRNASPEGEDKNELSNFLSSEIDEFSQDEQSKKEQNLFCYTKKNVSLRKTEVSGKGSLKLSDYLMKGQNNLRKSVNEKSNSSSFSRQSNVSNSFHNSSNYYSNKDSKFAPLVNGRKTSPSGNNINLTVNNPFKKNDFLQDNYHLDDILKGGNKKSVSSVNTYNYSKKIPLDKIKCIQSAVVKFLIRKKIKNKKIVLLQSYWRRYWLRSRLYISIKRYYMGRALIVHLRKLNFAFRKRVLKDLKQALANYKSTSSDYFVKCKTCKNTANKIIEFKLGLLTKDFTICDSNNLEIVAFKNTSNKDPTFVMDYSNENFQILQTKDFANEPLTSPNKRIVKKVITKIVKRNNSSNGEFPKFSNNIIDSSDCFDIIRESKSLTSCGSQSDDILNISQPFCFYKQNFEILNEKIKVDYTINYQSLMINNNDFVKRFKILEKRNNNTFNIIDDKIPKPSFEVENIISDFSFQKYSKCWIDIIIPTNENNNFEYFGAKKTALEKISLNSIYISSIPKQNNLTIVKNQEFLIEKLQRKNQVKFINSFFIKCNPKPLLSIANEGNFEFNNHKLFVMKILKNKIDFAHNEKLILENNFIKWKNFSMKLQYSEQKHVYRAKLYYKLISSYLTKILKSKLESKFQHWKMCSMNIHSNILTTIFARKFSSIIYKSNLRNIAPIFLNYFITNQIDGLRKDKLNTLFNRAQSFNNHLLYSTTLKWKINCIKIKYSNNLYSTILTNLIKNKDKFHKTKVLNLWKNKVKECNDIKNILIQIFDTIERKINNTKIKTFLNWRINLAHLQFKKKMNIEIFKPQHLELIGKQTDKTNEFKKLYYLHKFIINFNPSIIKSFLRDWKIKAFAPKSQTNLFKESLLNYSKSKLALFYNPEKYFLNKFKKTVENYNKSLKIKYLGISKILEKSIYDKYINKWREYIYLNSYEAYSTKIKNKNCFSNIKLLNFKQENKIHKSVTISSKDGINISHLNQYYHNKYFKIHNILFKQINDKILKEENILKVFFLKYKRNAKLLQLEKYIYVIIKSIRLHLGRKRFDTLKFTQNSIVSPQRNFQTEPTNYITTENIDTHHNKFKFKQQNKVKELSHNVTVTPDYSEDHHVNFTINTQRSAVSLEGDDYEDLKIGCAIEIQNAWRNYITRMYLQNYSNWLNILHSLFSNLNSTNQLLKKRVLVKWRRNVLKENIKKASNLVIHKLCDHISNIKTKRKLAVFEILKNLFDSYLTLIIVKKPLKSITHNLRIFKAVEKLNKSLLKFVLNKKIKLNTEITINIYPKASNLLKGFKRVAVVLIQSHVRRFLKFKNLFAIKKDSTMIKNLKLKKTLEKINTANISESQKDIFKRWCRTAKLLKRKDHSLYKIVKITNSYTKRKVFKVLKDLFTQLQYKFPIERSSLNLI